MRFDANNYMALIKCPDCGNEVSENAPACPRCGNPRTSTINASSRPILVEQTSKTWKLVMLISVILAIIGVILFITHLPQPASIFDARSAALRQTSRANAGYAQLGSAMFVFGVIGFMVGKFGSWWNHR